MRSILSNTGIKGLDIVLANMRRATNLLEELSTQGLVEASILLRRETETTPPMTPVDLGNLRASWFTVVSKKGVTDGKSAAFVGKQASKLNTMHAVSISAAKGAVNIPTRPSAILGYSANYAAPVHEMLGATFQRPGAGPKWLESALKRNQKKIVALIGIKMKLP